MKPEEDHALGAPLGLGDEESLSLRGLNRHEEHFFEELTRANNDLTNLQRELARQNAALTREMAARQQAEASLRLLGLAVEQSMESILITDAQVDLPGPHIVFVNPAFTQMTGYSAEEVIGKTPRILQGPRTDRAVLDRLRKSIEAGDEFFGTTINYRKDGSEFNIEWHLAPLRDAQGKTTHFVSVQRDISERVRTESALQKANAELVAVSRLAGMAEVATSVLHNVGNALNSVNVSANLLAEQIRRMPAGDLGRVVALLREQGANLGAFFTEDPRGPKVTDFLTKLSENFTRLQGTESTEVALLQKNVEHIKEIVAMQQSYARFSGATETLEIVDLVEETLRLNAASFQRHDLDVVREFAPGLPPIVTEKHKVLQILVNLVSNAKQACEESSQLDKRITLRVSPAGDHVAVQVIDTGMGIPPENLARIFHHGFTTKKNGHGFGLHSAANAAKELGGSLRVESDGPGRGATFTLELPCTSENSASQQP